MGSWVSLLFLPALLSEPNLPEPLQAELGGTVVVEELGLPRPSPVPVTVRLFDGPREVASAPVSVFGHYRLTAEPGDYWLTVEVGGREAHHERVRLPAGSVSKRLEVQIEPGMRKTAAHFCAGGLRSCLTARAG
jgi:hypothetical protein